MCAFFLKTYTQSMKKPVKQCLIIELIIFCANTVKTHNVYVYTQLVTSKMKVNS